MASVNLANVVQIGLARQPRAFTEYLPTIRPDVERAVLCFTRDGLLVLGLRVDDNGPGSASERHATALLWELLNRFPCYLGVVAAQQPPPRDETALRALQGQAPTLAFVQRDG